MALTTIGNLWTLESSVPLVDPNEGLFWRQTYSGPQAALITQQQLLNIQPDERVTLTQRNGPVYEMVIVTPDYRDGQSSALNKFDLITHEVEKSIWDHPAALGLPAGEMETIKKFIIDKTPAADLDFGSEDSAIIYSKLLLGSGSAKTLDFERTFKYSIVTSTRYATLVSESNIKRLWTAAQIINPAFSGIVFPAGVRFNLAVIDANAPAPIGKSITTVVTGTPVVLTETYSWSWLKLGAEFENLPSGKVRITQSWMGDMWSEWEYDAAS